jgi:uncharacterized protein (TIGR02680 family)
MKDHPPSVPLPQPTRERWQPLRIGLVELYHYDAEEFWFRDGHLLLRGNNGTGKSKVLSLTLPFILDGNLSASRVEPDADRTKRMDWNLLMNGRHQRRIGYSWMELGIRDSSGEIRTLTIGCGMRAIAGKTSVDTWFFVTEQRIGQDLWLTTHERTALSRERLEEAIGAHGQVFTTGQAYRRAVDERIFHLGSERYAALVDTLIQLRQPQLSKQPDEKRLSAALTEALPPLNRAALEDVADAMSQLDDIRRELDELDAMRTSIVAFMSRYRRYAQIATRRRARVLRQAQTEYDQASRELNEARADLDRSRENVAACREREQALDEQVAIDTARLDVLKQDPLMRDAARIEEARREAQLWRESTIEADLRTGAAKTRAENESRLLEERERASRATRSELLDRRRTSVQLASQCGFAEVFDLVIAPEQVPDGLHQAHQDVASRVSVAAREVEQKRREQVAVVRRRLRELEQMQQKLLRAKDARNFHADAFDRAMQSLELAIAELREASAALTAEWMEYGASLQVLKISSMDALASELELWTESQTGQNPLRSALEQEWRAHGERSAAQEAERETHRKALMAEQTLLIEEQQRLLRGDVRLPPAPHTRGQDVRRDRPGAPFWQLVDFADHVPGELRASLEAGLEAAGVLDAWVLPKGDLIDPLTHDVVLAARQPGISASLREWLKPTIPSTTSTAGLDEDALWSLLSAIECTNSDTGQAEMWISPHGGFRVGALLGSWNKPKEQYIGHAAREAAKRSRLNEIAAELERIDTILAELSTASEHLTADRIRARSELDSSPSDERLQRAHAQRIAADRQRRESQERLGEADSQLMQAEADVLQAKATLADDARDLALPSGEEEIIAIEDALREFRVAATSFSNAIQLHRTSLLELDMQRKRDRTAREDIDTAEADHASKQRSQRAAEETLATLEATVGKQVAELLEEIESTEATKKEHQVSLQRARAELNVASSKRGTAEEKCNGASARLDERSGHRKHAIDELQVFVGRTGLFSVALPDLAVPETAIEWGVDAALTLARRAEQSLTDVAAEDADWSRIQATIGRDLTDLQTAMSAQGHAVEAEPSDYGLTVRVAYHGQTERPDALQQKVETDLAERRMLLSAQERAVLEQHLEKEIAANLQRMIQETEQRVTAINAELYQRPTSTGVRYKLDWNVVPDDDPNAVAGLAEARKRLLRTRAEAWSADDRHQVGEFLRERIESERARDEQASLADNLARALDYRRWHRFRVLRLQDGAWKPLSGPASSGERALGLTVPLFAAASSHYESAHPHAPRLVLMDEAFAGIDDEARANCMALIREFDLDFVMTSEREWGCYPALPGLSICQLIRREGMDAVYVSRWSWDGRERRQEPDPARRFPGGVENAG